MPTEPALKPSPLVITPPSQGATSGMNLLRNADFASQHAVEGSEITIPDEWEFWYETDAQTKLARQDRAFEAPECQVWRSADASADEKATYFAGGGNCLKVFKPWGGIWWRLSQTVTGLTVGQRYRFTVPIYPDLYMKIDAAQGKEWADDPLAGEVRLTAASGGQTVEAGWLDGYQFPYGQYTPFTLDFVARAEEAQLSVEGRGRWGILNNGWVCNGPKLEVIGQPLMARLPRVGNLLTNGDFTGGLAAPTPNLPGVQAPSGWTLWCADEQTPRQAKQTESFRPPRAGLITATSVSVDDKDGLSGGLAQAYRLVGNWRAIWFSLSQKVTGLTPGQPYVFKVQMLPDPVEKYVAPHNTKQWVADPDGAEVWLKAESGGQTTTTLKRVNADFKPGAYLTFSHTFAASGSEALLSLEVQSRFALTQSAWYIAAASLAKA